ncbi:hypothetical protein [Acetobacter pomorum]|nr:hypothetical protein [Acetobacter pomorum]
MLRLLQGQFHYVGLPFAFGRAITVALALFVFLQFGGIIPA